MNKILAGTITSGGYRIHGITNDDGYKKKMRCHRLTALAFLPNPDNHKEIDHINRNKLNNCVFNLRWISHAENQINTPLYKRKIKGDGFRHIIRRNLKGNEYFLLEINRNKVRIVQKCHRTDKYTIDQVVHIRNEFYKKHDIDIEDK